jgi:hypothetical protein
MNAADETWELTTRGSELAWAGFQVRLDA